jgi:hypothetical protein
MDIIDLDLIGNPENPYRYWISSDLAKNATITIPKEQPVKESAWDRIKTIEEQIADIYNQLDKLKKPLRCKSLL